jgi:Neuraminidase (sialidase)
VPLWNPGAVRRTALVRSFIPGLFLFELLTTMTEKAKNKRTEKPTTAKLTRLVSFRLAESDHAAYLQKVEASGRKPSAFFRECVLTNKTQIIARHKASVENEKLIFIFNKTSNNLNQLAYRANAEYRAGIISGSTYTRILDVLEIIAHEMKDVIRNAD